MPQQNTVNHGSTIAVTAKSVPWWFWVSVFIILLPIPLTVIYFTLVADETTPAASNSLIAWVLRIGVLTTLSGLLFWATKGNGKELVWTGLAMIIVSLLFNPVVSTLASLGSTELTSQPLPKWEYHKVKAGVVTTIPVAGVAYCFDDQGKYRVVEKGARTSSARIEVSGPDGEIAIIRGPKHLVVQTAPGCAKFF